MKLPLKWLLELCPIEFNPERIAKLLTESGSEVEEIQDFSSRIAGVVVGRVAEIVENTPLPGMTKCMVDYGAGAPAQVLSRAPGIKLGAKYPFAPIGARLFGGKTIGVAEFEGVASEGMLCSGVEIGLGEPKDRLLELRADEPLGGDISKLLGWDDFVLELEITPNRPDCYGILSLARELSALTGAPLVDSRKLPLQTGNEASEAIKIRLEDSAGCPRYCARVVEGVEIGPSPLFVMGRLLACGVRPINNIVDATNYIMMFLSHPLHAFDLDKLGSDTIVVRSAAEGEAFVTLDGEKRTLNRNNLMIATPSRALAVAGVMGGKDSEVDASTQRILIESAYFNPRRIRASSRGLGLVTESSLRFERGADPNGAARAVDECSAMMNELAGGVVRRGIVDEYPEPIEPLEIKLSPQKVASVIGVKIPEEDYSPALKALGFERTAKGWIAPTFRPDVTREIDLVEEVGRLYGYGNLEPSLRAAGPVSARNTEENIVAAKIGELLRANGFFEVMSDTMAKEADFKPLFKGDFVRLENPISSDFAVMRPLLVPNLLRIAGFNLNRESSSIRLYEIDKIYRKVGGDFIEGKSVGLVAGGAANSESWSAAPRNIDFFDLKGVIEALAESLCLELSMKPANIEGLADGKALEIVFPECESGFAGLIDPALAGRFDIEIPIFSAEFPLEAFVSARREIKKFAGLPRFPSTRRDVALIVDSAVPAGEILDFAMKNFPAKLERAFIFDVYEGKSVEAGKKSVGLAAIFRDGEATITDIEANELHSALVEGLLKRFSARIRK